MFLLRVSDYSLARKTHYDVLKLRKNCTDKEIKEAFIQMSKEVGSVVLFSLLRSI